MKKSKKRFYHYCKKIVSRSHKKHPYIGRCITKVGEQKQWKKQCNKTLRVNKLITLVDSPSPGYFRKCTNQWNAPNDGKLYWPKDAKSWRK